MTDRAELARLAKLTTEQSEVIMAHAISVVEAAGQLRKNENGFISTSDADEILLRAVAILRADLSAVEGERDEARAMATQDGFVLQQFSMINRQRCERWHPKGINSWSLSDWVTATCGELGEAANVVKKLNRIRDGLAGNGALTEPEIMMMLGKEIADTFCYLDLLATAAGFDLADIVRTKFNEISERNGFPERAP